MKGGAEFNHACRRAAGSKNAGGVRRIVQHLFHIGDVREAATVDAVQSSLDLGGHAGPKTWQKLACTTAGAAPSCCACSSSQKRLPPRSELSLSRRRAGGRHRAAPPLPGHHRQRDGARTREHAELWGLFRVGRLLAHGTRVSWWRS
jgi:hypothetical protein